jgi:hypothetical protein
MSKGHPMCTVHQGICFTKMYVFIMVRTWFTTKEAPAVCLQPQLHGVHLVPQLGSHPATRRHCCGDLRGPRCLQRRAPLKRHPGAGDRCARLVCNACRTVHSMHSAREQQGKLLLQNCWFWGAVQALTAKLSCSLHCACRDSRTQDLFAMSDAYS